MKISHFYLLFGLVGAVVFISGLVSAIIIMERVDYLTGSIIAGLIIGAWTTLLIILLERR